MGSYLTGSCGSVRRPPPLTLRKGRQPPPLILCLHVSLYNIKLYQ